MKQWILAVLLIFGHFANAQGILCAPEDRKAFDNKIQDLKTIPSQDTGELLVEIGKTFIGTPYVAGTLEVSEIESLVINFSGLDCTTFVENVLAFGILFKNGSPDFDRYTELLRRIRYRNGQISGYASRLHYFSEWITNNEQKGLVKNITPSIGGVRIEKARDFMTVHRELYPHLESSENYKEMIQIEKALLEQPLYYLPKKELASHEKNIQHGDIIALATGIKGLDVTHTGIASREADGRIYLLHASSKGQVELSKAPLTEYLAGIKSNTGILVARPTF
ncbi:MAG: DUF1460 domain-containing protein [Eudoraea sp.]|nr:DUF1460 domain-containing protein [Eudoraea sp.]NNJ40440.1 DUF1460 domain-containing protein [Eudoraea sp.]